MTRQRLARLTIGALAVVAVAPATISTAHATRETRDVVTSPPRPAGPGLDLSIKAPNSVHRLAGEPGDLVFDGTDVWVLQRNEGGAQDAIVRRNATTGQLVGTYAAGPYAERLLFDGVNIWVSNDNGVVVKLNAALGLQVASVTVGEKPDGMIHAGGYVWVGGKGYLARIDKQANEVVETYPFPGLDFGEMTFDGEHIWATTGQGVMKFDPISGVKVSIYSAGGSPTDVAFDNTSVWVANAGSASISKLLPDNGEELGEYVVGGLPTNVTFGGGWVWVVTAAEITKVDPTNGQVFATFPYGTGPNTPHLVDAVWDGHQLWVTDQKNHTLVQLFV